jgi:hypothetical protein
MSVTLDEYRRARYIVADAAAHLHDAVRPSKRGRATLNPEILLTGMVLSIDTLGSATVADIYTILTKHLPRELQWDLGVRWTDPTGTKNLLRIDSLYQLTKRITAALEYGNARASYLSEKESAHRQTLLRTFTRLMVKSTLTVRPTGSKDYAMDGSAVWAFEKARTSEPKSVPQEVLHEEDQTDETADKAPAPACADDQHDEPQPEAPKPAKSSDRPKPGRGHKGGSDARWGAKTHKSGTRSSFFGYMMEALVRVPMMTSPEGGKRTEPALIEDFVLLPASVDMVAPCLAMLDDAVAAGSQVTAVLVDRHYSYKAYDRWFAELTARGIRQVSDLHANDQGFRDWDGMKIAASWVHCPGTPTHLAAIPTLSPTATEAERETFQALVNERQAYAAQRVGGLNGEGESRWRCPAREGSVGCPRVEGTVAVAQEKLLPIVSPPSNACPKLCTQETVQIRIETEPQKRAMKQYQKEYWGSRRWRRDYNRRTYVEGFFGVLKSSSATDFSRGTIQYIGLPLVTIALTCAAAVTNLRLLRSWHAETELGDEGHPLLLPDEPFHGFTQLSAEGAQYVDDASVKAMAESEQQPGKRKAA